MFNKKSVIDEIIPLIVFMLTAALIIVMFNIKEASAEDKLIAKINDNKNVIDAYDYLMAFIEQNKAVILSNHKSGNYNELRGIANRYFSRLYSLRNLEWGLEITDSTGKRLDSYSSPNFYSSSDRDMVSSLPFPLPEKNIINFRLSIGGKVVTMPYPP